MAIEELTIKKLRKNIDSSDFLKSYENLILNNQAALTDKDIQLLFKLSIIFLSYGDYSLAKLAYRIVLRYSNIYHDYQPLYDVSLNKGYIPISKFIEVNHFNSEEISKRFFNTFYSAYKDNFKQDNIYLSFGQRRLVDFSKKSDNSYVLIAPTSYGKSEIIVSKVLDNTDKKTCIIVPSKALLAQTKRRLLNNTNIAQNIKRIITHPEMYKATEQSFVAVLTQERLLRLLQKHPDLILDVVMIDEAHNLLRGESRAILLTQVLLIVVKRNPNAKLNFYTPFISNGKSLECPYAQYKLESQGTDEYIKVERFYHLDFSQDKLLYLYDQFLNKSFMVKPNIMESELGFLQEHKANKNIIYLNRPKDIENLAKELSKENLIELNQNIQELINAISDFLHPDYNLLQCIRAGIVYHHGGMPDVIRLYVENIFSTIRPIQFIITNSTLLEGVNIPAEKIFILCNKIGNRSFTKSQFKNLIGRVCRFNEVFHPEKGNLDLLEPEIYLIKGKYTDKRTNLIKFLQRTAKSDLSIIDNVENVMLLPDETELTKEQSQDLQDSIQYLENIEKDTIKKDGIVYVNSDIAKLCFLNNVHDFDIIKNEKSLIDNLKNIDEIRKISTTELLIDVIYKLFINKLSIDDNNDNFLRLANEPARKFYAMILEWRTTGSSYKQMIGKFIGYWNSLTNKIIFAGSRWGEIPLNEYSIKTLYINLANKTDADRVNLAILRIKEEQDYVDNNLIKYIEIINDLGLLNEEFYDKIKYGTSDKFIICLLKNGFSLDLARCIRKPEYSLFLQIDIDNDEIILDKGIIQEMKKNGENPILIFEATYHTQ